MSLKRKEKGLQLNSAQQRIPVRCRRELRDNRVTMTDRAMRVDFSFISAQEAIKKLQDFWEGAKGQGGQAHRQKLYQREVLMF